MLNLKILRRRIASVKSTQQITRAMYMVAAARLRRAQERILSARPYADKMREVVESLYLRAERPYHPLFAKRELRRVEVFLISTDRGLCGSYNQNLFRRVERFLKEGEGKYEEVSLCILGRKGWDYFRRRIPDRIKRTYVEKFRVLDYGVAQTLAKELMEDFLKEGVDGVFLAYNFFRSPVIQRPTIVQLLPLEAPEPEPGLYPVEHLYEPSPMEIFSELLPRFVEVQVYRALLEHVAGEFGARMTAMDNATKNAQDLIDKLTLLYNKARQASITKEVIEIATGAEALKQR